MTYYIAKYFSLDGTFPHYISMLNYLLLFQLFLKQITFSPGPVDLAHTVPLPLRGNLQRYP